MREKKVDLVGDAETWREMLNGHWYISTLSILKWQILCTSILCLNDLEHIATAAMRTVEFLKFCISFFFFHVRLQSKQSFTLLFGFVYYM